MAAGITCLKMCLLVIVTSRTPEVSDSRGGVTWWLILPKMVILILLMFGDRLTKGSSTHDVCISENFKVQCQPDEVILMEKALYGRMDTGRCLSQGSDNIGCSNDVLGFLDQWCSGQNMCDFMPIAKFAQVKTKWCGQMLSFLRTEHRCLKGL
ncbi:hypothetical protein LSH36_122g02075 [Paralvinella palmiformis]|uniref:SUEL-type lectin domain-containing protein n=1 Tax=Paralvinella palmiformis TaxID=53620 RepID=A0AAD9N8I0_9ANNE|nr:hypothetical protein LSH36_122g02075 [Paralvinella palmiformis]